MRNRSSLFLALILAAFCLCAGLLTAPAISQTSPPVAPAGTPLQPLWPFVAGTLRSFASSQFTAGDLVCFDLVNSTSTSLYVLDNGTGRCAVNQPQAGVVWTSDLAPSTSHAVIIEPEVSRVAVNCPLGVCPPTQMMQPCNALRTSSCFR